MAVLGEKSIMSMESNRKCLNRIDIDLWWCSGFLRTTRIQVDFLDSWNITSLVVRMPEPHQLVPLQGQMQPLYSDGASHPISKGEPRFPAEETHLRLYPQSSSISHFPKIRKGM